MNPVPESIVLARVEQRKEGGRVAYVTINNPAKRNAMAAEDRRQLAATMRELAQDDELRVAVITGAGDKSFIGGANIGQMSTFPNPDAAAEGSRMTHLACDSMRRMPVPVIARINGYCLGTGMEIAAQLTQFGAYGDPGRDPRMNVVTVAYLAVVRDVGAVVGGTDASEAALMPVSAVLNEDLDLAFDHLRIVRDAVERIRVELEVSGIATAFVGPTFTMAELRAVYEAIWGVQLDAANFRRSIVAEDGWVIPTGRRARPGSAGGRPAELYRPGRAWEHGGPIHRFQRSEGSK